jgi:cysteine desulfurase
MQIYLDNAATTPVLPEVVSAMSEALTNVYGNPSSIHQQGRMARAIVEKSRTTCAKILGAKPSEIIFTSGGTEGNTLVLLSTIRTLGIRDLITSSVEHPSVLTTLKAEHEKSTFNLHILPVDQFGHPDLLKLESLLKDLESGVFVSLMHANNELGTKSNIESIGDLVKKYNGFFHSDCTQTVGHHKFNLSQSNIDFITCSAHKFHGPKGVGLTYIDADIKIDPLIIGGGQERNMRAGTEAVHNIVGLERALKICNMNLEEYELKVKNLKNKLVSTILNNIEGTELLGDPDQSNYTVASLLFPAGIEQQLLQMKLDIAGISVSGGSACSSGTMHTSPVMKAIGLETDKPMLRFSFSHLNTEEEIDKTLKVLKEVFN